MANRTTHVVIDTTGIGTPFGTGYRVISAHWVYPGKAVKTGKRCLYVPIGMFVRVGSLVIERRGEVAIVIE